MEQGDEVINNYLEENQKSRQMPKHEKHIKALRQKTWKNGKDNTETEDHERNICTQLFLGYLSVLHPYWPIVKYHCILQGCQPWSLSLLKNNSDVLAMNLQMSCGRRLFILITIYFRLYRNWLVEHRQWNKLLHLKTCVEGISPCYYKPKRKKVGTGPDQESIYTGLSFSKILCIWRQLWKTTLHPDFPDC